jgi:hypothetical protein
MLGEALWYELRPYGIDVLTLTISEVATPAMLRSGSKLQGGHATLTPEAVIDEAFQRIGRTPGFVTGRRNRAVAFVGQHLVPKRVLMRVLAQQISASPAAGLLAGAAGAGPALRGDYRPRQVRRARRALGRRQRDQLCGRMSRRRRDLTRRPPPRMPFGVSLPFVGRWPTVPTRVRGTWIAG